MHYMVIVYLKTRLADKDSNFWMESDRHCLVKTQIENSINLDGSIINCGSIVSETIGN